MSSVTLHCGDCLDVMRTLDANSIHAIVCDPPYGLSFMGKHWDHGVPGVAFWQEALRVAKPGSFLLAFGGTRTHHRLMVAIEDAGWKITDCLMWLHAQGFPKGIAIDKAIDKHLGAERDSFVWADRYHDGKERQALGSEHHNHVVQVGATANGNMVSLPATPEAAQWAGWHSSLKPAWEPIILAMKPLDGTYANNALVHGVGGLNIDASRIEADEAYANAHYDLSPGNGLNGWGTGDSDGWAGMWHKRAKPSAQGRWPANLLLDDEAARLLDEMSGERKSPKPYHYNGKPEPVHEIYGKGLGWNNADHSGEYGDTGGASRYFARFAHDEDDVPLRFAYVPKASKRDRDEGLEGMELRKVETLNGYVHPSEGRTADKNGGPKANHHPTVKPTALMRYLCRLVTPPNGTILDPFLGSGSTLKAAKLEGFNGIGIEIDPEYLAIAEKRIAAAQPDVKAQLPLLELAGAEEAHQ